MSETWYKYSGGDIEEVEIEKATAKFVFYKDPWWGGDNKRLAKVAKISDYAGYFPTREEAVEWGHQLLSYHENRLAERYSAIKRQLKEFENKYMKGATPADESHNN